MSCLRLCYEPSLVPEAGQEVVCCVAGPVTCYTKEAAGHWFHQKALRIRGLISEPVPEAAKESSSGSKQENGLPRNASATFDSSDAPPPGTDWGKSGKKKKSVKKRSGEGDMYRLLGLQDERWMATETQIKNGYRRQCLEYHPDKAGVGVVDEETKAAIETKFKAIQEAYEVLSDPVKRREYDSTDDFDDSLPSDCGPGDWFKSFGAAFRRNARWSIDTNVPDVGSDASTWEEVEAFYDFWFGFRSWREFPHPDEEDAEGAESREHRRWIERINSKLREKGKKEEAKRMRDFVEAAYRCDPRVLRRREEEKAEKERKKKEKEAARVAAAAAEQARQAAEDEARRLAAEEEKKAAEEAKKAREAEKKLMRKERQRLRIACESVVGTKLLIDDDLEKLCQRLDIEGLTSLNAEIAGCGGAEQVAAVCTARLSSLMEADAAEAAVKEAAKREVAAAMKDGAARDHARKVAAMREWSEDELRMLDKAATKFPVGTPKRWEQVTAYIRTRTMDEVMLMVKERKGAGAARLKVQEDWKGAQKHQSTFTAGPDLRCQVLTDVDVNLVGEAAAAAEGNLSTPKSSQAPPSPSTSSSSSTTTTAKPVVPPAPAAAEKVANESAAASTAPAAAKKVVSADSGEWSEVQELALVKALKTHGKELEDRWERISKDVPGKSKAQCFKRFKELREVFRTKKGDE